MASQLHRPVLFCIPVSGSMFVLRSVVGACCTLGLSTGSEGDVHRYSVSWVNYTVPAMDCKHRHVLYVLLQSVHEILSLHKLPQQRYQSQKRCTNPSYVCIRIYIYVIYMYM